MSASSLTLAKRHAGVCQGSLIKAVEAGPGGSSSSKSSGYLRSSSAPAKVPEYCVLVGVRLTCYESWLSMDKGHHPTAIYSVVGASAISNAGDASFRVVTNQGTHLWCLPPSSTCRDLWLRALIAGLERHFAASSSNGGAPRLLKPIKPRYHAANMKNPPLFCNSCGKLEKQDFPLVPSCSPLAQYGMESRMDLCPKCHVAQGLVEHVQWMQELYAAQYQEQQALLKARVAVLKSLLPGLQEDSISKTEPTTQIELTPLSHHKLSGVLTSAQCVDYSRVSPTLEKLSIQFSQGLLGCMEFIELLEHSMGIKDSAMAKLKQQAFRFNGDMGTALKLLAEHALPNPHLADDDFADNSSNQNSIELLQCILEFFLDLLEEGELQSVAFFWPQLLNIHLQMLPASDSASLQRIELVEDFLLTVSTQHSIQLAIELIWSYTADLEDARTLPYCAKRKYAVLRFLCELESLLFDFEMGWGGGSVTVGQFLAPSTHQIAILKSGMRAIQAYRMAHPEGISRSQRQLKLLREKDQRDNGESANTEPEKMATEALRIAKNADYLSTHMAFTKRLGDIAGRLFYQPIENRMNTLQNELAKLNSSGTMGGDPLNRVKVDDNFTRVVRIPIREGHVFRSKERTPVLLLVETLDESAEVEQGKPLTPFPKAQPREEEQEEKKNPEEAESAQSDEQPESTEEVTEEPTIPGTATGDTPKKEDISIEILKDDTEESTEKMTVPDPDNAEESPVNGDAAEIATAPSTETGNGRESPGESQGEVEPSTPRLDKQMQALSLSGSQEGLQEDITSSRRKYDWIEWF